MVNGQVCYSRVCKIFLGKWPNDTFGPKVFFTFIINSKYVMNLYEMQSLKYPNLIFVKLNILNVINKSITSNCAQNMMQQQNHAVNIIFYPSNIFIFYLEKTHVPYV